MIVRFAIIISVGLFLVSSCAHKGKATTFQKVAYGCLLVATAADMYTTDRVIEAGGVERNPLRGSHSNSKLLMFGIGSLAVHTVVGYYSEFWRNMFWSTGCVIETGVSVNNIRVRDRLE